MLFRTLLLIAAAVTALPVCTAQDLRENEMVVAGSSAEADGFWISGMSLCLRRDMPGVACGMIQAPQGERRYSYLLLIKGDPKRRTLAQYDSQCRIAGANATSSGFIELEGKRVTIAYQADLGPDAKNPLQEKLTLNGKPIDFSAGRVVLVDFTGQAPAWQQVKAKLPANPDIARTVEQVEAAARAHVSRLEKEHKAVRAFRQ